MMSSILHISDPRGRCNGISQVWGSVFCGLEWTDHHFIIFYHDFFLLVLKNDYIL
uniref:Uncharacterized protein n=1 Tax=Oryzias sinensis TaxID=183150 RepID=A0A8C7ZYB2_9TELE